MSNSEYREELEKRLSILRNTLTQESARELIIAGTSVIDDQLKELLLHYFNFEVSQRAFNQDPIRYKQVTKTSLRVGGPLHDLSAKSNLAYLLGLIHDEHKIIEVLASIRNKFAHDITVQDYSNPVVAGLIKNLLGKRKASRELIMEKIMTAVRPIVARTIILREPKLDVGTKRVLLGFPTPI